MEHLSNCIDDKILPLNMLRLRGQNVATLSRTLFSIHVFVYEFQIGNPDEFDVMFTVPADRVDVQPFGSDGAYYSVKFKRNPNHDLKEFLSDDGILCARDMLTAFRSEVKAAKKTIASK